MVGMKLLRSSSSNNKLRIYQSPLAERIFLVVGIIFFTSVLFFWLVIIEDAINEQPSLLWGAIGWVILYHISCICAWRSYMCLDMDASKLIIQEFPGWKRVEINLSNVKEITVTNDFPHGHEYIYTLNVISHYGQIRTFHSWSTKSLRRNKHRQKERLKAFVREANKRLMNRDS